MVAYVRQVSPFSPLVNPITESELGEMEAHLAEHGSAFLGTNGRLLCGGDCSNGIEVKLKAIHGACDIWCCREAKPRP